MHGPTQCTPPSLAPHLDIFVIQHSFQAFRYIRSSFGLEAFVQARGICSEPSQYKILSNKLLNTNKKIILQIAVKVINNLVGLNSIIPTLLVFRAYPYIIKDSLLFLFITKQIKAIYKAIKDT